MTELPTAEWVDWFRRDRWVFGNRNSGAFLPKFAWTGIVRHKLVKGGASMDDPALILQPQLL
ncbi:hypothetical protein (plasmid) [Streptomyces leeuwenhoekii]|uniref:Uncharacterized protein n=2 Tax=Streptomyces leeuwenhoekii TaxID=1437453 RepID=A0A0F7VRK1_STRLW|nr:hypothetical protein [Streptomyces leeuwenhoekii]